MVEFKTTGNSEVDALLWAIERAASDCTDTDGWDELGYVENINRAALDLVRSIR